MSKVYVNSDFIRKRSAALHSTSNSKDAKMYYERAKVAETNQLTGWESDVRYFIDQCCNITNANRYHRQCRYFLGRANDRNNERLADFILHSLTEKVMLYMDAPGIDNFSNGLTEQQMDAIDEATEKLWTADRILNNHDKLSKRFHIDSIFTGRTKQTLNLEKALIKACAMVDTYDDINPPAKLAMTLEEVVYNLQINQIEYDPKKVVAQITEYFLNRDTDISESDYTQMKAVLEDCHVIRERDMRDISYFTRYHDNSKNTAVQYLNRYMSNPNKSTDTLQEMVQSVNLLAKPNDIVKGFSDIMSRIRTHMVCESSIYGMTDIGNSIRKLTGRVIERAVLEDTYTKNDVSKIRDIMVRECGSFDVYCTEANDIVDYNSRLYDYKKVCERCVRELDGVLEILYTNYNREVIRTIQESSEKQEPISLDDFKNFRFQSLLHLCREVDAELERRSTTIKKTPSKISGIKKRIGIVENDTIFGKINSDGRFDVCVERFELSSGENMNDLHTNASNMCKNINDTIFCRESDTLCYYLVTDALEFHVECSQPIKMTQEEKEIWEHTISDEDVARCVFSDAAIDFLRDMDGRDEKVDWRMQRCFNRLTVDEAVTLMDLATYSYTFTADNFKPLVESYLDKRHVSRLEESRLTNALNGFEHKENVPLSIANEAHYLMDALLEAEDDEDKKDNPKDEEKPKKQSIVDKIKSNIPGRKDKNTEEEEEKPEKKNPFSGINFNSIKLYCAGLKKKLKDMSSKERELSRNLDTAMERLSKSMKDALISDRRESIIKGSVIPSFSKCIKLTTAVAGIGIISPPAALITVVAGFVTSKKLTKQERLLMLDEIETELEVVDKEIEMAQSKNQIKRYRKLLQWKKQLQREYQRIRYNVKIGKDMLPGSSTGIKGSDD